MFCGLRLGQFIYVAYVSPRMGQSQYAQDNFTNTFVIGKIDDLSINDKGDTMIINYTIVEGSHQGEPHIEFVKAKDMRKEVIESKINEKSYRAISTNFDKLSIWADETNRKLNGLAPRNLLFTTESKQLEEGALGNFALSSLMALSTGLGMYGMSNLDNYDDEDIYRQPKVMINAPKLDLNVIRTQLDRIVKQTSNRVNDNYRIINYAKLNQPSQAKDLIDSFNDKPNERAIQLEGDLYVLYQKAK